MLQSAICHQQPAVGAGRGSRAAGREAQALGLGSAISFQQTAVSRIQRFVYCTHKCGHFSRVTLTLKF